MKYPVGMAVASLCLLSHSSVTHAAVVINEIYNHGGQPTSTYDSNFVELYNPDATSWNLDGWSVQYSYFASNAWSVPLTPLSGQLAPGSSYLIALPSGVPGTGGAALPTPDATDSTTILHASGGRVALVSDLGRLLCDRACAGQYNVIDLVAWGSINILGGSGLSAGNGSATQSIQRQTQTFTNWRDFGTAAPTPTPSPVPLPAAAWLMLSGLGGVAAFARRRRGEAGMLQTKPS